MNLFVTRSIFLCLIFLSLSDLFADGAGGRASFTRGGYAGAKYVAFGGAAEAYATDVFSIYWNPAGLASLYSGTTKSPDEIRQKTEKGDVSDISEEDLLKYSDAPDSTSVHFGASASSLDVDRNVIFGGGAMRVASGALGIGVYSVYSPKIEEYDESANKTGTGNYSGSVFFLSYGQSFGVSAIGISLKGLHERISDAAYAGAACDIGVRAEILPFVKVGFVAQDLGIGLYPVSGENLEKKYDLGSPTLRSSILVESRSANVSIGFGIVRHIEQDNFIYTVGLRYDPSSKVFISTGFYDEKFSAGVGLHLWKFDVCYAFSYDRINMGYNNTMSVMMVF